MIRRVPGSPPSGSSPDGDFTACAIWLNMSLAYASPGWFSVSYRTGSQIFGVSGVQQTPADCALTCTNAQPDAPYAGHRFPPKRPVTSAGAENRGQIPVYGTGQGR